MSRTINTDLCKLLVLRCKAGPLSSLGAPGFAQSEPLVVMPLKVQLGTNLQEVSCDRCPTLTLMVLILLPTSQYSG